MALRRFASRRLPTSDVDDVLQETWIAAWERVSTLEEASRFRAWVFSICYHKIQDSWRKRHTWAYAELGGNAEQGASYVPKEIAQIELRECIASFWDSCPTEQREVLRMYYADGLTLNEIGQILSRNLNTVKYQFYRAHELAASKLPDSEILLAEVLR
jgi:RNA polymerase sigma-70 factor (ECF subfamily)